MIEPLLQPDNNCLTMFPIKHKDIWDLYKRSVDCFWKAEDIDLSKDYVDWLKLSNDERHFIKMVLGFFAASDGIIIENMVSRFMVEMKNSQIRAIYSFQTFMENVHSETYSLLIDTYIKDTLEKEKLFNAIENFPCIKLKAEWASKWIADEESSFATRLVAFAIVEGLFFSSSFASIFWLKQKNILPGLCLSNEYISRDESIHVETAIMIYGMINEKVSEEKFIAMMKSAVEIEIDFVTQAIPVRLIGMHSGLMSKYICFVADRLCLQLGHSKIYNEKNPFNFMEKISLESKSNMFEKRISEYSLANKFKEKDTFDLNGTF
jgi:ribonucleotide reductase beta subunit family protein with ferritin-like domain